MPASNQSFAALVAGAFVLTFIFVGVVSTIDQPRTTTQVVAADRGSEVVRPVRVDVGRSAEILCTWVDSTGLTSAPCKVDGWKQSVVWTLDMAASEARKTCSDVAQMVNAEKRFGFTTGWKLVIQSPYSTNPTAWCHLA